MTARCRIPNCPYPVRTARKVIRRDGEWVTTRDVPISDRCVRHDEQRPESKPVRVEDFDPERVL